MRAGGLHWWRRYVACGAISCTGTVPDWSPVCNGARLWLQWPTQGVPAGLCCLQTAHSKACWAGLTLDAYPCGVPDHWLALMADVSAGVAPRPCYPVLPPPEGPYPALPASGHCAVVKFAL